MSGRTNQNVGVIEQLLGTIRYIVIARNGTFIPCVNYTNFKVIHKELPDILLTMRDKQAAGLGGKFADGWRLSHGNDHGDLPEFSVVDTVAQVTKIYASERLPNSASVEAHKFQQFQEYDVTMVLGLTLGTTKVSGSKEMSDLGASRILVDECFGHVYFSLEHYREITTQTYGTLNPWVFILFAEPAIEDMVRLEKLDEYKKKILDEHNRKLQDDARKTDDKKKPKPVVKLPDTDYKNTYIGDLTKTGPVPVNLQNQDFSQKNFPGLKKAIFDVIFEQNNFVETKAVNSAVVRKETFNSMQVTVLVPARRKRARRGSLTIANTTFDQVFQPPQPQPQPQPQQPQQQGQPQNQ